MEHIPSGYVLVPTNLRINHIGAIHGPFATKDEAKLVRDLMDFPTPGEVFMRPLFGASVLSVTPLTQEQIDSIKAQHIHELDPYGQPYIDATASPALRIQRYRCRTCGDNTTIKGTPVDE